MNEMTESLNIINQVIHKLIKYKKPRKNLKKTSDINPHQVIKYLYPKA